MIFFDTETTGLEPGSRIIELGAVRVDDAGQVVDTFHRMINPGMPLPADALSVNRITKAMLETAAIPEHAFSDWLGYLGDEQFAAAHFSPYDVGVITWAHGRAGVPLPTLQVIDTCAMAQATQKAEGRQNSKLQTVVAHHGIKAEGEAHRAIADCHSCRRYYDIAKLLTEPKPVPWDRVTKDCARANPYTYAETSLFPDHLAELAQCVAEGAPIAFNYTDASGNKTSRSIIPYGWADVGGVLQFHGLDVGKGERRTFLMNRTAAA